MNKRTSWLCFIRPKDWGILRKKHIYVLPEKKKKTFEMFKKGDFLAFLVSPRSRVKNNGIVGIGEIVSLSLVYVEPLAEYGESINTRYPYRVKVDIPEENTLKRSQAIPLHEIFGYENIKKGFVIEPFMHKDSVIELTRKQMNYIIYEISKYKTK